MMWHHNHRGPPETGFEYWRAACRLAKNAAGAVADTPAGREAMEPKSPPAHAAAMLFTTSCCCRCEESCFFFPLHWSEELKCEDPRCNSVV